MDELNIAVGEDIKGSDFASSSCVSFDHSRIQDQSVGQEEDSLTQKLEGCPQSILDSPNGDLYDMLPEKWTVLK